jgi:hypothetical protein
MFAAGGSPALPPVLLMAGSSLVSSVRGDPLAMNRPSFAAAVASSSANGCLLPFPIGLADERPFTSSIFLEYVLHLSRRAPLGTAAAIASLAATPVAVLASVTAPVGACSAVALTWSRSVHGPGPALLGLLLSPLRDALVAGAAVRAAAGSRLRVRGVLFHVRKGGTLAPAARPDDD